MNYPSSNPNEGAPYDHRNVGVGAARPEGSSREARSLGSDSPRSTDSGEERRWVIQVCDECDDLFDGVENHRHREGVHGIGIDLEVVPAERAEEAEYQRGVTASQLDSLLKKVEIVENYSKNEAGWLGLALKQLFSLADTLRNQ